MSVEVCLQTHNCTSSPIVFVCARALLYCVCELRSPCLCICVHMLNVVIIECISATYPGGSTVVFVHLKAGAQVSIEGVPCRGLFECPLLLQFNRYEK